MDIADSQFILELRRRMQANRDAGRPEGEGIEREDLKRMLNILRSGRATMTLRQPSAAKGKTKAPVAAFTDAELNDLFN
jgi:hypothetical protein